MLNKIYSVNNFSIDLSVVYTVNLDNNKIQFTNTAGHTQIIRFDSSREAETVYNDLIKKWTYIKSKDGLPE